MADLAEIIARYEPDEIADALAALADPERLASLAQLVERALGARSQPSAIRSRDEQDRSLSAVDDRVARVKERRPSDAELIDNVIALAKMPWTKARADCWRDLTKRYDERPITGKTAAQRRLQLVSLVERAQRSFLEEIIENFRPSTQQSGTLQEWSDIILRDRKPKPEST